MKFIKKVLKHFENFIKYTEQENSIYNAKECAGIVKGGIYKGITFIPGNDNKEWIKDTKSFIHCPAEGCDGFLYSYYQEEYYRVYCDKCNLLYDTGMDLTGKEIKDKIK